LKLSKTYINAINKEIGEDALEFEGITYNDLNSVKRRLDTYDMYYDKDDPEPIILIDDCLKCTAYYETVNIMKIAYNKLIKGTNKGRVTRIQA